MFNMLNFGPERLMGNWGNNHGLGGVGKVMTTAEDPFGLRYHGLHASPWTNMEMDERKDQDEAQASAQAFAEAMGTGK